MYIIMHIVIIKRTVIGIGYILHLDYNAHLQRPWTGDPGASRPCIIKLLSRPICFALNSGQTIDRLDFKFKGRKRE